MPAGRLHAFGASFAIDEAFVVLAATLLVTAAFLLVTLLAGRVWCGWSCPQTVLGDLTRWVERPRGRAPLRGWRRWRRPAGFAVTALVSALVAANLLWYFVSPYEFFPRLLSGRLGPVLGWSWVVLALVLFLDLAFVRTDFCVAACPYARLQGVLFDRHTLVVAYDAGRDADCVDCGACVRVCPTGIDIREGLQMECIACAACIDACTPIMAKLRRAPDLIGYFHGEPGGAARPVRPGTLALGAATLAALVLLVAVVLGREAVDLVAMSDATFSPRSTPDGTAVNAFSVALENRARGPVTVGLAVSVAGGEVSVKPAQVALRAGERRQVRLVASARGLPPGRVAAELVGEVRDGERLVERRAQPVSFVVPEVR